MAELDFDTLYTRELLGGQASKHSKEPVCSAEQLKSTDPTVDCYNPDCFNGVIFKMHGKCVSLCPICKERGGAMTKSKRLRKLHKERSKL